MAWMRSKMEIYTLHHICHVKLQSTPRAARRHTLSRNAGMSKPVPRLQSKLRHCKLSSEINEVEKAFARLVMQKHTASILLCWQEFSLQGWDQPCQLQSLKDGQVGVVWPGFGKLQSSAAQQLFRASRCAIHSITHMRCQGREDSNRKPSLMVTLSLLRISGNVSASVIHWD